MEIPIPDIQTNNFIYGKEHLFDVEVGMPVSTSAGSKLGIVTEVAGFGSTQLGPVPSDGSDSRVTQAQTGTGFLKVKRDAAEGSGTPDLYIPFRVIQEVTGEHGVILNDTFVAELQSTEHPADVGNGTTPNTRSGGWRKWLSGKKV